MPDTTTLADYEGDSPEAVEWRAIRERNVEEFRRLTGFDRFDQPRPRGVSYEALVEDAETLAGLVEPHTQLIARISAAGWLLFPDTSEHQGAFNLQWCKDAGFKVHAYKATEGRTYVDAQQARTRDEIRRLGLVGMVYGFVFWSAEYDSNPALWNEQGKWFAQHAPAEFAHAIDVEMLCTGGSTDVARVVAGYRSVYPDHPLMIYTNRGLYTSRSKATPADPSTLGLLEWHAGIANGAYTSATGSLPAQFNAISSLSNSLTGFPPEVAWQVTDHCAVAGQLVDGNAFKGTTDDFRRIFITGGDDVAITEAEFSRFDKIVRDRFATAWVRASSYGSDAAPDGMISPVGMTYQNYLQLRALLQQIGVAVADDPTLEQISAALSALAPGMTQAVVAGIRDDFPDVQLDYSRLGEVVGAKLDEHLGTLRIVSDAPSSEPARLAPASGPDLDADDEADDADLGVDLDANAQGNPPTGEG